MIAFIILHYNNIKETEECIDSLKKFNSKIVIVSNSNDEDNLKKIENKVDKIIINKENIGFAKANNIGCKYAIEKFSPDFLCVINNDVIIEQVDFVNQIDVLYKKYEFDCLGPKILPIESESKNPFPVYQNLEEIEERILYTKKLIKIYHSSVLSNLLQCYLNIKKIIVKKKINQPIEEDRLGVALHGCALIFSRKYYQKYQDVFYNETFLYHEEEFLYYRCMHDHLTFLYSPTIELIHKEGKSLDKQFEHKEDNKKQIFRNEEILKSLYLLEKVYQKGDAI